jgi:hypothetical protein
MIHVLFGCVADVVKQLSQKMILCILFKLLEAILFNVQVMLYNCV